MSDINQTEHILIGLASDNKRKLLELSKKLYCTPIEYPEIWEPEIIRFFSEEVIVPYIKVHAVYINQLDELMQIASDQ